MSKDFTNEELRLMAYDDCEYLTKVDSKIEDIGRWSIFYKVVFLDDRDGKYYTSKYSVGATEHQEERPYEYESDIISCKEVELKEVMVKQWVVKESE